MYFLCLRTSAVMMTAYWGGGESTIIPHAFTQVRVKVIECKRGISVGEKKKCDKASKLMTVKDAASEMRKCREIRWDF